MREVVGLCSWKNNFFQIVTTSCDIETLNERLLELLVFSICGGVIEVLLENAGVPQNLIENCADAGCFYGSVECVEETFVSDSECVN